MVGSTLPVLGREKARGCARPLHFYSGPMRIRPSRWWVLCPLIGLTWAGGGVSWGDWNQWRGPSRDGMAGAGVLTWPQELNERRLVSRWRVPLGPSYSGPLVVGDRVFVTEARDQAYEAVVALDRATGAPVWRRQWEGYQKVPFFAKSNGDWIRSTPAYAEGRLFVGGMRDVLVCLEAADGRELWRLDFPKQLGKPLPDFGFVSSPLVAGGAVYVQAGAGVAKVDASDGRILWRTLDDGGGMWGSAFSSPVIARLGGEEQLLIQTRDKLAGVSLQDGTVLWTQNIKAFRGMNILTPVVAGDRVLTSSYGGTTQGWTVTKGPAGWSVHEDWSLKVEGYMSTPVVVDGHAYLHSRAQRLVCVDLATGAKRWESEQKFGKYMSLVAQGNRVLALDQRGVLVLFRADSAGFQLLGERKLGDSEAWAHLAVEGAEVVAREQDGVSLWTWAGGS